MPPKHSKSRKKNNGEKALTVCVLPDDVTMCILLRLPVKSLLRFKVVCKPWHNLFATPKFIIAHHHRQFSKNQGHITYSPPQDYIVLTRSLSNIEKKPTDLDQIHLVMKYVGCCSGLICLGLPPLGQVILVCNPAMKLYKFLPLSKVNFGVPLMFSLGFGYDQERHDFKVVRIVYVKELGGKIRAGVEVYSSLSDSWETIKLEFEFHVFLTRNITILNGNPVWFAKIDESGGDIGKVWFDVRRMVFKKDCIDVNEMKVFATLAATEIEGMELIPLVDQKMSTWVFDDTTTLSPVEFKVRCSKNGKILEFWFNGKRFVFDPERRRVKEIAIIESGEIDGYSESLACIKGMKPLGN